MWVRILGLPVEYYREDILKLILEKVATPLRLDRTTTGVERGNFVRAAVEIDLSKPLVSMVMIRRRIQRIMFEGLHVICFECGEFGHRSADCKVKGVKVDQENLVDEDGEPKVMKTPPMTGDGDVKGSRFGPWMMVQKFVKGRGKQGKNHDGSRRDASSAGRLKVDSGKPRKHAPEVGNLPRRQVARSSQITPNRFSMLQDDELSRPDNAQGEEKDKSMHQVRKKPIIDQGGCKGGLSSMSPAVGKDYMNMDISMTDLSFPSQGLNNGQRVNVTLGKKTRVKGVHGSSGNTKAVFDKVDVVELPQESMESGLLKDLDSMTGAFVFGHSRVSCDQVDELGGLDKPGSFASLPEGSGLRIPSPPLGFQ